MAQEGLGASKVMAIGCHGQTIWHEPRGDTPHGIQAGDNNLIAALTGVTVVGDFRRRDIALGGQGAPLVPTFAWLAYRTLSGLPGNLPGVTGARTASVLGGIWPVNQQEPQRE